MSINLITVFPTGVGMNRGGDAGTGAAAGVPHRRGDEPFFSTGDGEDSTVFPTGVGMNRRSWPSIRRWRRVPHRRGDEPV